MDKFHHIVEHSNVLAHDAQVAQAVEKILADNLEKNRSADVFKFLLSSIDLTTLNATDSPSSVAEFTERVNSFDELHPDLPNVAAICVYPNFAQIVRTVLDVTQVRVACVAGGFPSSQTFPEVKVAEVALAVEGGADEIDVVLNLGYFLDDDWEAVVDEIAEQKAACRDARLKVILETGALKTAAQVRAASLLALTGGADFLKTSTGKGYPGASLEAAYVMAQCIKEYYDETKKKVGFKASGGVSTAEDALKYYTIIKSVLGDEWLTPELFRIGASRLANNILSVVMEEEITHF